MQGDLISRSALIETIEQDIKMTERFMEKLANLYKVNSKEYACLNAQLNALKTFKGIVEQKPTAYSVEKVVAELNDYYEERLVIVTPQARERVEEIVRNGGKE